jgi:hypothetical protein
MAVVRARTSPPYALIFFVVLWVISTGIAVYLYTQQSELKKKTVEAEDKLNKYVKRDEQALVDPHLKGTGTGFSLIQDQRVKLIKVITGNTSSNVSDVVAGETASVEATAAIDQAAAALGIVETKGTKEGAASQGDTGKKPASLSAAITAMKDKIASLKDEVAAEKANVARLDSELKLARDESAKSIAIERNANKVLNDEKVTLQNQISAANQKATEVQTGSDKQLSEKQTSYENQIRELNVQINELRGFLKKAQETIVVQKNEIMAGRRFLSSTVSDIPSGKIVRTNVAAGEVTLALGVGDHVTRGLTFQVFDQRTGIKVGKDDNEAKGAVEIVEVGENESRARIINLERNKRIEQGDLLYNLVFSQQKNRKYRFAVYGDFDIDRDGNATTAERERVIAMIKAWGGIVDEIPVVELRDGNGQPIMEDGKIKKAPQVMPETDFLVQGAEPVDPKMSKDLDLVSEQAIEKLKSDYNNFKVIEGSARNSGVTILNTNRFLYLIGYYNTTLVRY